MAYQLRRINHRLKVFAAIRKEAYARLPKRTAMVQQYRGSAVDIAYTPESLREIFVNNIRLLKTERMVLPGRARDNCLVLPACGPWLRRNQLRGLLEAAGCAGADAAVSAADAASASGLAGAGASGAIVGADLERVTPEKGRGSGAGVTRARAREGLELDVEVTRAELTAARIEQRILQLEGREDALESDLCRLTGAPAGQRPDAHQENDRRHDRHEHGVEVRRADGNLAAAERVEEQRVQRAEQHHSRTDAEQQIVAENEALSTRELKSNSTAKVPGPSAIQNQRPTNYKHQKCQNRSAAFRINRKRVDRRKDTRAQ